MSGCGEGGMMYLHLSIMHLVFPSANLLSRYFSELTNPIHYTRMGFALALGGLPRPFLSGHLGTILDHLITCATNAEGYEPKFAEARRDAVNAITRCVCVCTCLCPCVHVSVGGWAWVHACVRRNGMHNKSIILILYHSLQYLHYS